MLQARQSQLEPRDQPPGHLPAALQQGARRVAEVGYDGAKAKATGKRAVIKTEPRSRVAFHLRVQRGRQARFRRARVQTQPRQAAGAERLHHRRAQNQKALELVRCRVLLQRFKKISKSANQQISKSAKRFSK